MFKNTYFEEHLRYNNNNNNKRKQNSNISYISYMWVKNVKRKRKSSQILTHIRLMLHPYRNQFRKGLGKQPQNIWEIKCMQYCSNKAKGRIFDKW